MTSSRPHRRGFTSDPTTINFVRRRFKPEMLLGLNKLTGIVIAGFGVWIVWAAF